MRSVSREVLPEPDGPHSKNLILLYSIQAPWRTKNFLCIIKSAIGVKINWEIIKSLLTACVWKSVILEPSEILNKPTLGWWYSAKSMVDLDQTFVSLFKAEFRDFNSNTTSGFISQDVCNILVLKGIEIDKPNNE